MKNNIFIEGWYIVGYSEDLKKKQVKTIRAFGKEIVIFRGENNKVSAVSPYCPHLGAHLGHGGKVVKNSIRCPFHFWRFNSKGKCVEIPYSDKIPNKACVKSYQIIEKNNNIYLFYEKEQKVTETSKETLIEEKPKKPLLLTMHSLPDLEKEFNVSLKKNKAHNKKWHVRANMLDLMENSLDNAHFDYVHKLDIPTTNLISSHHQIPFIIEQNYGAKFLGIKPKLTLYLYSPSISVVKINLGNNIIIIDGGVLIEDKENIIHFMRFYSLYKKDISIFQKTFAKVLSHFVIREAKRQYGEDLPIWQNKVHLEKPMLCNDDGQISKIRRWYKLFYSNKELA